MCETGPRGSGDGSPQWVPSGVHGQSPSRASGGEVPQRLIFLVEECLTFDVRAKISKTAKNTIVKLGSSEGGRGKAPCYLQHKQHTADLLQLCDWASVAPENLPPLPVAPYPGSIHGGRCLQHLTRTPAVARCKQIVRPTVQSIFLRDGVNSR